MRNNLGGFFVLGFMIPCLGLFVVLLFNAVAGQPMKFDEASATIVGIGLVYWLARLTAALLASTSRRQRPHELFTPLYEKRPHEWTWRLA